MTASATKPTGAGAYGSLAKRAAMQSAAKNDEADASLRCEAHGCPNQWSSNFGARLCSAHLHAEPHEWPRVTEHQQWLESQRALARGHDRPEASKELTSRPHVLRHALDLVRHAQAQTDTLAWARKLQHAHETGGVLPNGRRITAAQVAAYRVALKVAQ